VDLHSIRVSGCGSPLFTGKREWVRPKEEDWEGELLLSHGGRKGTWIWIGAGARAACKFGREGSSGTRVGLVSASSPAAAVRLPVPACASTTGVECRQCSSTLERRREKPLMR
jgi:hypothetical protein